MLSKASLLKKRKMEGSSSYSRTAAPAHPRALPSELLEVAASDDSHLTVVDAMELDAACGLSTEELSSLEDPADTSAITDVGTLCAA
jgi:hypothetical protein